MPEKGIVVDDRNMDISDPKMIERAQAWFDEQEREQPAEKDEKLSDK